MITRDGFIYILNQEGTSLYKIGFTQDDTMNSRLSNIQVGNPNNIVVVGTFYTFDKSIEKEIHDYLKEYHVRGEWYRISESLVKDILNPQWRESQGWYSDNLELTIDSMFQEYSELHERMTCLMRKLRHVLSRYRVS